MTKKHPFNANSAFELLTCLKDFDCARVMKAYAKEFNLMVQILPHMLANDPSKRPTIAQIKAAMTTPRPRGELLNF